MKKVGFIILVVLACSINHSKFAMAQDAKKYQDTMAKIRGGALTEDPSNFGFYPDAEFKDIYGVIMEFHIDEYVASVLAMKDGAASLYSTSQFGMIGGGEWDSVKKAAKEFVVKALEFTNKAELVQDFPYPSVGEVYFYILTFKGVKLIKVKEEDVLVESNPYFYFFVAGQEVLTQLRLLDEKKENRKVSL